MYSQKHERQITIGHWPERMKGMCDCIKSLVEKGYVGELETANEERRTIEPQDYGILKMWEKPDAKNTHYFRLNYCPACGEKLSN
jgi:hypothetical protein